MKVKLLEQAKSDLHNMDNSIYILFKKHLKTIAENPFQRHLQHGLDFYVEELNKKRSRIVYTIEEDTVIVERCFEKHCDYEKWYKSFKRK